MGGESRTIKLCPSLFLRKSIETTHSNPKYLRASLSRLLAIIVQRPMSSPKNLNLESWKNKFAETDEDSFALGAMKNNERGRANRLNRNVVTRFAVYGFRRTLRRKPGFHEPDDKYRYFKCEKYGYRYHTACYLLVPFLIPMPNPSNQSIDSKIRITHTTRTIKWFYVLSLICIYKVFDYHQRR